MSVNLPPSTVRLSRARWLLLACLVVSAALVAAACGGEGEVFTGEPAGTIAFTSNRDGNTEIYLMNADGSGQRNATANKAEDNEAAWSADGSRLAFTSSRAGPLGIFAMNANGTDVRQLTDTPAVTGGARWSPDGSRLAFYSYHDQSMGLMWVMNADGSQMEAVLAQQVPGPQTQCSGGFPGGWFPDGQRILFRGSQGTPVNALQICSAAPDGSDIKVILSEDGVYNYYPSLSPDGRKIAFTSNRDGNEEIYVMSVDGSGLRRITDDPGLDEYPTWSPDGQWLAFHSDRDGDADIYIVRPDGSDLRRLTDNTNSDMEPSWAPR